MLQGLEQHCGIAYGTAAGLLFVLGLILHSQGTLTEAGYTGRRAGSVSVRQSVPGG